MFAKRYIPIVIIVSLIPIALWYWVSTPIFATYRGHEYNPISSPENLKRHVIELSDKLSSRMEKSPELDQAANYIFEQLAQFSDNVYYQHFDVHGHQHQNVVAEFGPSDTNAPMIVIGAHYDTYANLPGADDNASGVAGIIELARLLQAEQLKKPLQIVAYTLEEPPHFRHQTMGSYQHAKSLFEQQRSVSLMISVEMIGYFSDLPGSQDYPFPLIDWLYPDTGNFIKLVTESATNWHRYQLLYAVKKTMKQATPLPVYSVMAPTNISGIDYSDHRNYWAFDYPGIMVTDTAFYRNKNYHTPEDTWEKLDYQRMAMVVDGLLQVVLAEQSD